MTRMGSDPPRSSQPAAVGECAPTWMLEPGRSRGRSWPPCYYRAARPWLSPVCEFADTRFDTQTILLHIGAETTLGFSRENDATVAIFFTASCGVFGSTDDITYVDIDILVDSVAVPPTDAVSPFCTSGNAMSNAARDGVVVLSAGAHTLQVSA